MGEAEQRAALHAGWQRARFGAKVVAGGGESIVERLHVAGRGLCLYEQVLYMHACICTVVRLCVTGRGLCVYEQVKGAF